MKQTKIIEIEDGIKKEFKATDVSITVEGHNLEIHIEGSELKQNSFGVRLAVLRQYLAKNFKNDLKETIVTVQFH